MRYMVHKKNPNKIFRARKNITRSFQNIKKGVEHF